MNQAFDPINASIIQDNLGEPYGGEATISLAPEDVIDGHAAAVQPARRSLLLPTVAASLVLLAGIGGGAYYVMGTADPEPEGFSPAATETALPGPQNPDAAQGALAAAPTDALAPANPFEPTAASAPMAAAAMPALAANAPVVAGQGQTPAPVETHEPTLPPASPLPAELAAIASGAAPIVPAAAPAAAPQTAPVPQAASVVEPPPKAAPVDAPAPVKKPAPKPTPTREAAPVAKAAAAKPAPAKAEATRKIVTKPVEQAPVAASAGEAVKPLIVMTAQQIGLKALTRDGLVVASAAGTDTKTYRQGSVLPSGERVELLDAAAMVIVTDRNVIRIKP
ncbi:hypothetical protein [Aromatoleum evansii]|uniref:hypothetical protein n=1 Tax=Aromatoleum evansii TaxID=59406 RepID=UPI00145F4F3C|nr:hypothetical protein [Aromatoleum evansii]NMG30616.1 hypothetical protein [Aromatoleum evansii]